MKRREYFFYTRKIKINDFIQQFVSYFDDVFHYFLGFDSVLYLAVNGTVTSLPILIHNNLNCVPKMNEAFTGLERHGGKWLMTTFSFWGGVTLKVKVCTSQLQSWLVIDWFSQFIQWRIHTSCSISPEHFTLVVAVDTLRVKAGPDCSLFPHCSNPHSGLVLCACLWVVWGDHGYRVENKGSQDEENYLNNNTLVQTHNADLILTHIYHSPVHFQYVPWEHQDMRHGQSIVNFSIISVNTNLFCLPK